jgi:hypothetical protein
MVFHAMAHNVCDFVESAVIHLEEAVKDSSLDRLEPIIDVGDGAILDNVGSVFDKVAIEERSNVCHQTRFSMIKTRLSGVFFPI